jgi:hypothetical protein
VAKVIERVGARYGVRGVDGVYGRHPRVPRSDANMTRDRLSPLRVPTKLLDGVALVRTTAGEGGESDLL